MFSLCKSLYLFTFVLKRVISSNDYTLFLSKVAIIHLQEGQYL